MSKTLENVQDYYGKVLKSKEDLQTSACCTVDATPPELRPYLMNVHEEVRAKFYGCGLPIPPLLEGCTVLDLGSGSGQDAYVLSQLVGENGKVIGIDMTDEQLSIANQYIGWHMDKFGFKTPNVEFVKGYIEDLAAAGIEDNSVDVVVSNCVINLSPDKDAVMREIFRVLKPGGELYFSDVYAGRRISQELRDDPVLFGECLSGALYTEDFRRILREVGCLDYRVMSATPFEINNKELEAKIGHVDFYSITVRAFKLNLEDICEDYGQVAYYDGKVPGNPHSFVLDDHHEFFTGKPMLVCGNTADMVNQTRYGKHFRIEGDKSRHFGPFDCAPLATKTDDSSGGGACC